MFSANRLLIRKDIDAINEQEGYYVRLIPAFSSICFDKEKNVYQKGEKAQQKDHIVDSLRYLVAFLYPKLLFDPSLITRLEVK